MWEEKTQAIYSKAQLEVLSPEQCIAFLCDTAGPELRLFFMRLFVSRVEYAASDALVVDDDDRSREITQEGLARQAFETSHQHDGTLKRADADEHPLHVVSRPLELIHAFTQCARKYLL